MKNNTIPVLLLTGYLGSGKTTLLNRILTNERGIRFAVIVNDIGEVNIDASLIQKGGIVGNNGSDDLVALQNGCICCTLKMDLVKQLADIAQSGQFDYIVIEASGICEPEPIAQTICSLPQLNLNIDVMPRLDCITTVVDALRLKSEFDSGKKLMSKKLDEEDIENLIIQQIEFCDLILLNKISDVTAEEAQRIEAIIRALQPKARIIECDYCDVPLTDLLNTHRFNLERVAGSAAWIQALDAPVDEHDDDDDEDEHHDHHHHDKEHHDEHHHHHHHHHDDEGEAEEYGIQTYVYYSRPALDLNKFDDFVARKWPKNIIRCKGMLYFDTNPDMCYLFESAGIQKKLTECGFWCATAPVEELMVMMERDPSLRRDWDPKYGDRMIKLVFIGQNLDRKQIRSLLDACKA
ncbi:cobalamin synthesis protein P47K [Prevotella sp. CAG:485]|nr:cobalamin synthesis protein P47K [Prevotella sp. CAG:485]